MTNKEARQMVHMQQWSEMIRQRQDSGMTVNAWCNANGINTKTYYYRQNRVREAACKQLSTPQGCIAEVILPQENYHGELTSSVVMHIGGISIEINTGADEQTIATALRAVSKL